MLFIVRVSLLFNEDSLKEIIHIFKNLLFLDLFLISLHLQLFGRAIISINAWQCFVIVCLKTLFDVFCAHSYFGIKNAWSVASFLSCWSIKSWDFKALVLLCWCPACVHFLWREPTIHFGMKPFEVRQVFKVFAHINLWLSRRHESLRLLVFILWFYFRFYLLFHFSPSSLLCQFVLLRLLILISQLLKKFLLFQKLFMLFLLFLINLLHDFSS